MVTAWSQLKGHNEQRELFRRSVRRNRMSHAYVLSGPEGIGKLRFARLLAMSLFCREHQPEELDACGDCRSCRGFLAGTWPDYIQVNCPEGKSEIPIELLIGAREKRGREGMCYELAMAPQASDRRIAVIDDAHRMNADGANAILKTLEEPPADAVLLLICNNPESLLPTIRSRCQIVRFFPLADAEVAEILQNDELVATAADAAEVASMAEGSLAVASQLLNPDLRRLKDSITEQLGRMEKMQPLVIARQVADDLDRISSGGDEVRRNAQWLLRFVTDFLQQRLRHLASGDLSDPLTQRLGVRTGVDLLSPMLARVCEATQRIDSNTPVRLVLESLFDDLARQFRVGPVTAR